MIRPAVFSPSFPGSPAGCGIGNAGRATNNYVRGGTEVKYRSFIQGALNDSLRYVDWQEVYKGEGHVV